MTYLQLVNDVLARLRESSVASVTTNSYSTLIGKFVNDAKRQVEDSFDWNSLFTTITVTTTSAVSNYVITGSGYRLKILSANDSTNRFTMINVPLSYILNQQQVSQVGNGSTIYYALNGFNGTDSKVELFPTPNGAYALKFNCYVPQAELSTDATVLTIPSEAVIAGAYARALVERGEDGGLSSSEAYGLYKGILADQISIEASRHIENECWVAV